MISLSLNKTEIQLEYHCLPQGRNASTAPLWISSWSTHFCDFLPFHLDRTTGCFMQACYPCLFYLLLLNTLRTSYQKAGEFQFHFSKLFLKYMEPSAIKSYLKVLGDDQSQWLYPVLIWRPPGPLLQQMETITKIHNWPICTMGCPTPNDTSTIQPLHLRLRDNHGGKMRKIIKAREPGFLLQYSI